MFYAGLEWTNTISLPSLIAQAQSIRICFLEELLWKISLNSQKTILQSVTLCKRRLRCFPVNCAKCFRTVFLQTTSKWKSLYIVKTSPCHPFFSIYSNHLKRKSLLQSTSSHKKQLRICFWFTQGIQCFTCCFRVINIDIELDFGYF